jgi:Na+-transporting NADH:ubiquinone oxidoreductase subunit B
VQVPPKPKKTINWQLPMQRVLYALVPIVVSGVYFFGWRSLLVVAVANAVAFGCEFAFTRREGQPVTSAVFVTGTLFALSLPPMLPLWMVALGVAFGVVFGKMVFGGFGKNVFNPALTGRAFIYISFGDYMTSRSWTHPIEGLAGGLLRYAHTAADALTQATPATWIKYGPAELAERGIDPAMLTLSRLVLGNVAGVIGGTSALLVIVGGLYLIYTKAANWRLPLTVILGFGISHFLLTFFGVAYAANAPADGAAWTARAAHALYYTFAAATAGSLLFGAFFYATDPVSAPKTDEARWIYGAAIGVLSSLIGIFSVWPAGTMFAILFANMFAPITDIAVKNLKEKRKAA